MVGIVILNYNNSKDTIACVNSVLKYIDVQFKLLLVDNGSTNKAVTDELINYVTTLESSYSCKVLEDTNALALKQINLLLLPTNIGYARGNKQGLSMIYNDSEIDYIMILNNDILFTCPIVGNLINILEKIEDAFLVSPLLFKRDGKTIDYTCARNNYSINEFFCCYIFKYFDIFGINKRIYKKNHVLLNSPKLICEKMIEIEMPSGSCFVTRKGDFFAIGDFDPNTFLYCEENILSKKIQCIKKKSFLIPSQTCIHLGGSTTSQSLSSFIAKCSRDSILYYIKNYTSIHPISYSLFKLLVNVDYFKVCISNNIKKLCAIR